MYHSSLAPVWWISAFKSVVIIFQWKISKKQIFTPRVLNLIRKRLVRLQAFITDNVEAHLFVNWKLT